MDGALVSSHSCYFADSHVSPQTRDRNMPNKGCERMETKAMWLIGYNNTDFLTLACISTRGTVHYILIAICFYRTEREWNNSLITKRVLFEVFDCFIPLFYIAFYQLNVVALRRELVGLFWGKFKYTMNNV